MVQDAIGLLERDLRTVRALLSELIEPTDEAIARGEVLQRLEKELDVHSRIKEEIFYPALKEEAGGGRAAIPLQASADQRAVERMVLPDLKRTEPGTPEFIGRARVLKDLVEDHARRKELQ